MSVSPVFVIFSNSKGKTTAPASLYKLLGSGKLHCAVKYEETNVAWEWKISPVGWRIPADGKTVKLDEIKLALKCVLKCLASLHREGFVHRDIRWSNIIKVPIRVAPGFEFRVIDFDYGEVDGAPMNIENYVFSNLIEDGSLYTNIHDMILVHELLTTWRNSRSSRWTDVAGLQFHKEVAGMTASDALNHLWFNVEEAD